MHHLPEPRRLVFESFAGGASLAYVTLDLLVELTYGGREHVHATLPLGPEAEHSLFAVVLAGLTVSYVVDALVGRRWPRALYAVRVGWGATYNALVGGALVLEAEHGFGSLALYAVAMLLHLTEREAHARSEWQLGGWHRTRALVAAAPALGALLWSVLLPTTALYVALAVVAGSTIVQVFRDELPSPRASRVGAFVLGVAVYAAIIAGRWLG
jgi:hypothetical protein